MTDKSRASLVEVRIMDRVRVGQNRVLPSSSPCSVKRPE